MSSIILNDYQLSREYMDILQRYPVLSEPEEREYSLKLYEDGDRHAAETLVLSNLRGVLYIARQYHGYGLAYQDLVQEGVVGLMRAVKRYNPYKYVRVFAYAIPWIKAEIQTYIIKNWKIVKLATTDAKKKLFFGLRKLKNKLLPLERDSIESLSETLNIDQQTIRDADTYMCSTDVSIDANEVLYLADGGSTPEEEVLTNEYNHQLTKGIPDALNDLDERSRDIVVSRHLKEPLSTLQELASKWGISMERVRQIENKALGRLRSRLSYFDDLHT